MELKNLNLPQSLVDAVLEQFGDEQYFTESAAEDINNHGASGGWNGFVYYSETVPFGERIRAIVKPVLQEYAKEFGKDGIFSMMHDWKCLGGFTVDEIAEGWASNEDEAAHTAVMNALAWFTLEEVARAYVDSLEA